MKKKNKGFTLIELLAVIVILGLLMAIAIPSVTRYITQSRKKTLITTIGNYVGALGNEVNSLEYTLTESNTVYAVPIECIALERGGNNPFGEWKQANDKYWAYVLVQYDDVNSSYKYGFTFKDSSGYGLYPTAQNKLSNSDKDVRTGLSLTRPKKGKVTTITDINNWGESGFAVDTNTNLVVLVSESEGKVGDGRTTCTLQQKGNNYAQVEKEKEENKDDELKGDAYALVLDNSVNPDDELPLIFVRSETPIKAGDTYISDRYGNIKVLDAYTGFETAIYESNVVYPFYNNTYNYINVLNSPWSQYSLYITSVVVEDKISFASLDSLFESFLSLRYADVGNIDVSQNTSLSFMFSDVGMLISNHNYHVGGCVVGPEGDDDCYIGGASVKIVGIEKWNTTNVTDMSYMFSGTHISSIGDISVWNTSNVVDMSWMFFELYSDTSFSLDLSKWDVDKVTNWLNISWDDKIILPSKFLN